MLKKTTVVIVLVMLSQMLLAQDERFVPKPVPASPQKPQLQLPQQQQPADVRDAVLVERLDTLLVTSSLSVLDNSIGSDGGVQLHALQPDVGDGLKAVLQPFIGQPVSLALLDRINRQIVSWYRQHGYPVSDALAPGGQDITDGRVQITVLVARRGAVSAQGGRYFDNADLLDRFAIAEGEYLGDAALQRELDWANRNPFRSVNLQLAAGEQPGFTDLNLLVQDRLPLRVYGGVEDTGNEFSGKRRWLAGINWGNAFGLGHQLGYQYITAERVNQLSGHSLSYSADLPWRNSLSAYASRISTRPDLDNNLSQASRTVSAGFRYHLPWLSQGSLQLDGSLGYAYLRSNSNLEFGGQQVFANDYEVSQLLAGLTLGWQQPTGSTHLAADLHISPGGMTTDNDDRAFDASRSGASADYQYLAVRASHRQQLPAGLETVNELRGQLASGNLVSSEQFGLGGYASIRGYDEYALIGDHGLLLRNELRLGGWNPAQALFGSRLPESLQGLVFFDIGMATIADPLPGEQKTSNLRSAGLGLRYQLSHHVTARLDYGWQLKALSGEKRDSRGHFSLIVAF